MTNNQVIIEKEKLGHRCCSTISWASIFAGAFVAIGLSFLLYAFATAIGLSAFTVSADNITSVAIGGFIAMLIGGIIIMYVAGLVAGFLNHCCCPGHHCTGALSGFLAWCLALVISALLAAQMGQLLNVNYIISPATSAGAGMAPSVYSAMLPGKMAENMTNTTANTANNKPTQHPQTTTMHDEKMVGNIGKALFLTFLLFFFGALASAFGGHYGMRCCRKSEKIDRL